MKELGWNHIGWVSGTDVPLFVREEEHEVRGAYGWKHPGLPPPGVDGGEV